MATSLQLEGAYVEAAYAPSPTLQVEAARVEVAYSPVPRLQVEAFFVEVAYQRGAAATASGGIVLGGRASTNISLSASGGGVAGAGSLQTKSLTRSASGGGVAGASAAETIPTKFASGGGVAGGKGLGGRVITKATSGGIVLGGTVPPLLNLGGLVGGGAVVGVYATKEMLFFGSGGAVVSGSAHFPFEFPRSAISGAVVGTFAPRLIALTGLTASGGGVAGRGVVSLSTLSRIAAGAGVVGSTAGHLLVAAQWNERISVGPYPVAPGTIPYRGSDPAGWQGIPPANGYDRFLATPTGVPAWMALVFGTGARFLVNRPPPLTGDVNLSDSDAPVQSLDPNGANRIVMLPFAAGLFSGNGAFFWIINRGLSHDLLISSPVGAIGYLGGPLASLTLGPQQALSFLFDGSSWFCLSVSST